MDELAEIDGIRPNVVMVDGDEKEAKSASSSGVYKVKRTWDHYYCSCPAWRNQSGHPVNARTCKHLKSLLGESYESARLKLKNPDGQTTTSSKKKPAPKSKPPAKSKPTAKAGSKRKKPADEEEEEAEDAEEDIKPDKKTPPKKAKKQAPKTRKTKQDAEDVEEEEVEQEDDEAQEVSKPPSKRARREESKPPVKSEDHIDIDVTVADPSDELAVINGIKPKVVIADGDEREMKSMSSSSTYKVKRTWDHYYCSCPAWRNQGGHPVNARTCKHLRSLLGDAYEEARLKMKNPDGPAPTASKGKAKAVKKPASKSKAKKDGDDNADDDDEEDEDEDDAGSASKPQMLLANKWDLEKGVDPTGWWASEKLDGVRVFYDGKQMFSRLGNPFTPPQSFLDKLPKDVTLDGELFGGRNNFQDTVSIVKTVNSPHWKNITFQIFDVPSRGQEPFEARVEWLREKFVTDGKVDQIEVVEQTMVRDRDHVFEMLKEVETKGGEGSIV